MATLRVSCGSWELETFHRWKDRDPRFRVERVPLVSGSSRVATIGSCFAEELVEPLRAGGVRARFHPIGRMYNTASIRQEIERLFGTGPAADPEIWRIDGIHRHPLGRQRRFASDERARTWLRGADNAARRLFTSADVIVVTIGLVEAWRNIETGFWYPSIPYPQVFRELPTTLVSLQVSDMIADLERIRSLLAANGAASLVVTVSPIPMSVTFRSTDVRIANMEGKSRIRAAVSEFVEAHDDVHYFHAYEVVSERGPLSEITQRDGRHLQQATVEAVVAEFVRTFWGDVAHQ